MTEDQRDQWRKALAAKAAASRRAGQRGRRGVRSVRGAGMVRILPPRNGTTAAKGAADGDGPGQDPASA